MAFSINNFPVEIGIKELSYYEAAEVFVARAVHGRVARGRQSGFDVYRSTLFPGETFQVKFSAPFVRKGLTKMIGDRKVAIRDTLRWTFSVSNSDYKADWYVLFGERDGLVYPFLLSCDEWEKHSCGVSKQQILVITAQEHSKCGRYPSSYKRNRRWEYYIRYWPIDLLAGLGSPRMGDQLEMAI